MTLGNSARRRVSNIGLVRAWIRVLKATGADTTMITLNAYVGITWNLSTRIYPFEKIKYNASQCCKKKRRDKKDNLKDHVGILGRAERGGRTRSLKIKSLTLYRLS